MYLCEPLNTRKFIHVPDAVPAEFPLNWGIVWMYCCCAPPPPAPPYLGLFFFDVLLFVLRQSGGGKLDYFVHGGPMTCTWTLDGSKDHI